MKYMLMLFGDQAGLMEARSTDWIRQVIEFMHCQDFADTGVMVEDAISWIGFRIVVSHPGLRTAHELGVAENDPRLIGLVDKTSPKAAKSCAFARSGSGWRAQWLARDDEVRKRRYGAG